MPRYFIKTYGCQMNIADSERLAGVLEAAGYRKAQDQEQDSDIILINTCVVRQNAEDRAAGYISSLKGLKSKKPELKIGVCGCLVTEPGRDVKQIFPHVDLFIGPNEPGKLRDFVDQSTCQPVDQSTCQPVDQSTCRPEDRKTGRQEDQKTKYITIMHGCDNFCSYCIVPYVRGREVSRPMDEIIAEISSLDDSVKEIMLLGQNVNSYKYGLAELLRAIEERNRNRIRIRFMTSHPRDMSDDIINAVADLPNVCEYFHLPIQHGDDEILKSMNRGYTFDYYRKLVDKIRKRMPNAEIATDVIVGYPGETEAQFEKTLDIIKEIKFNEVRMAAYSPRPQTKAAKLPDQLPEEIKQARLQKIIQVVREVVKCYNPRTEVENNGKF